MKQIICKNMKKMLSCIVALSIIACLGVLTSCSSNDNPSSGDTISEKADLVVYGTFQRRQTLLCMAKFSPPRATRLQRLLP